jgi:predicted transposase/invertase (TIGR01784 family)
MQKGFQEHFRERAVYYTSFPINEQGRKAKEEFVKAHGSHEDGAEFKWDYSLKPVTVVAILNFMFDHDPSWPKDRYHSSYRLREDCTNEVMTEVVRYVFLELGRFRKRLWELETPFDKWMYLLRHMHEMVEIPVSFQTPEFKRLFLLAKIGNFTPDELKEYEKSLNNMSDYYNIIDSAVARAEKAALERGREEGREEARLESARKLKQMGVAAEIIAKATGLSPEEIAIL